MCGHALQTSTDQNQGGSNQLTSHSVLVYVCVFVDALCFRLHVY